MGTKNKHSRTLPRNTKTKGKKWKKGHSSSSNPEIKRFREAAKNRFFQPTSASGKAQSTLTVDALAQHDQSHLDKDGDVVLSDPDFDVQTAGGSTFKTWATNWTDCTNATFNRVHRYWASNSALHREILAILAAVTEVIKTQGGQETETEYFAALMTAMETTTTTESLTAIMYLISLVIKRVPVTVLRSRFSEVAKQFLDAMATHSDGDSTSLLKSLILSLSSLLRVQEQAIWKNSSTQRIYSGLLSFVNHKKPKVRKAAQQGVCIVLRGSLFMTQGACLPHHPAAAITAKYCIQQIEECGGTGEALITLHTLALLKDIIGLLPSNSVKSSCETLLRLMTLSNVTVTACSMQTLHGLFSSKSASTSLTPELNAQLITALYDYQPAENDVQPVQAWLAVMEKAHVNLARLDEKLCISHLPRIVSTSMACLLSEKTEVAMAATKTIKILLKECLEPAIDGLNVLIESAPEGSSTPLHKIVKAMESGLSYQFYAAWGQVLQLFAVLYEVCGKYCPKIFKKFHMGDFENIFTFSINKSLQSIANLRDSPKFPHKAELDHVFGCAVKTMGPRYVLEAVPLNITGENDDYNFPRSWIIPVIRDNVANTELGFFTSYFLPLAAKFRQRCLELAESENVAVYKSYEALQLQIWSLLPGFCTKPTDLSQSFKGIAKVLGSAISDRPDLRMDVMASLRKLITHSLENDESKREVGRFSKNFLPILFNLFTMDSDKGKDPMRLAVLETIKSYMQITDAELVSSFCDKCLEKQKKENITAFKRHSLLDLSIVMIPYLEKSKLKNVYEIAVPNLENEDRTIQKKSYRILEEICGGASERQKEFVREHLSQIQSVLLSSLSTSTSSSKAPRLRCLIHIFSQLESKEDEFLMAVVPEAILCTKEVAERARAASYNLLVEMGRAQSRWESESDDKGPLHNYFKLVMAGLAGSPHMISATLLALTRIMYEFKEKIDSNLLEAIVDNICLLLTAKPREVVKSALAFLKVLLSAYPDTTLAPHLKQLMSSLVSMKQDCHHHFRFKSKEIYAKLIRKFGYETIYSMSPASIHKVLVNIRKTQERTKKKKKEKDDEKDEDSDEGPHFKSQLESVDELLRDTDSEMEDDDDNRKKKKQVKGQKQKDHGKKSGLVWLQEGDDMEITDFLDPNTTKKVLATKPEEKKVVKSKTKATGFKTAPDGRLIITESSDEEDVKGKGRSVSDDEEDLEDLFEALEGGTKSKKAKKRKLEDLGSDDDEPSKYKAGGSGIHRPVGQGKKSKTDTQQYGFEYKAKKAAGDVKKKGKLDPYAYVPLDYKSLNKRKKAKFQGQFKNLVKGAKKGALKGSKGKKRKK